MLIFFLFVNSAHLGRPHRQVKIYHRFSMKLKFMEHSELVNDTESDVRRAYSI